jgi:hypothetical protein
MAPEEDLGIFGPVGPDEQPGLAAARPHQGTTARPGQPASGAGHHYHRRAVPLLAPPTAAASAICQRRFAPWGQGGSGPSGG